MSLAILPRTAPEAGKSRRRSDLADAPMTAAGPAPAECGHWRWSGCRSSLVQLLHPQLDARPGFGAIVDGNPTTGGATKCEGNAWSISVTQAIRQQRIEMLCVDFGERRESHQMTRSSRSPRRNPRTISPVRKQRAPFFDQGRRSATFSARRRAAPSVSTIGTGSSAARSASSVRRRRARTLALCPSQRRVVELSIRSAKSTSISAQRSWRPRGYVRSRQHR